MFQKIDHIGIAVRNLDSANKMFEELSGAGLLKVEEVVTEGVKTSFFYVGDTKIEFLEPTNQDSPISKFIEKNGEGLHHIAFEVENVGKEIQLLKSKGFEPINEIPKEGADNKMICF